MTGAAPMIEARGLSVAINETTILRKIDLAIARGESVAIIGPNGAGKTTLLKSIGGMVKTTGGHVRVQGKDVAAYSPKDRARLMAYVPQSSGLVLSCTAFEFVLMARYAHFTSPVSIDTKDKAAALCAMDTTGTADFRDRRLNTLSGGERQKVFIAAALAQDAPIVLLDEPAAFLDYKHEAELIALAQRLNKESGLTVISVNHDLNQGVLECGQALALNHGRLVFSGSPQGLTEPGVLQSIFQTPFDIVEHDATGRSIVIPLRRSS
ncbi:MAG: ABC transporter ATP-binding protein [Candidatus Hydrogenedentes bacterium]|nr:ABC transporter ATP-binding protein [Candidatus Hydrogenedentota bacterium]